MLLESVLDALPYPVFVKNADHQWIYGNRAFQKTLGAPDRDAFQGLDDRAFFTPEQVAIYWAGDDEALAGHTHVSEERVGTRRVGLTRKMRIILPDGSHGVIGIVVAADDVLEGGLEGSLGVSHDASSFAAIVRDAVLADGAKLRAELSEAVTARNRAMAAAHTDAATGLKNRNGFDYDLDRQIAYAKATGERFAVSMIDLDHFKKVNDRFGHAAGDAVLQTVGRRISQLPHVLTVARLGGDEFAAISRVISTERSQFEANIEAARKQLFTAFSDDEKSIPLSGSLGLCIFPDDGQTPLELKHHADLALLSAKRGGRARSSVFNDDIARTAKRRSVIESRLAAAIDEKRVRPAFQPIMDAREGRVAGLEVFARWTDDELGEIGPDEFIAVAEETGLASRLDAQLFATAAGLARPWLERGDAAYLSFNLSSVDMVAPGFAPHFLRQIEGNGLEPGQVQIEVEAAAIQCEPEIAMGNIMQLREAGVRTALSNYGEDLMVLQDSFTSIKVDRAMVDGIETSDDLQKMMMALLRMSRTLGVDVAAQGVETAAQLDAVRSAGCHTTQGYHYAPPMEPETCADWLAEQKEGRREGLAA